MAQKSLNSNSQNSFSMPAPICRTANPSSEFYSLFSEEELLGIIHALESRQEIPLKYSYKGRGANIWNSYYSKYIIPKWYRTSSVEIDLLRDNFESITKNLKVCNKFNIVDVGAGNSYPVKNFIHKLNKLTVINKYIALDISEELLKLSNLNFRKWFPQIEYKSDIIDIENHCLLKVLSKNQANLETDNTPKIILHLGVTMGNHHNRIGVLKNFRDSMGKNDVLVFTNEIGSNSNWDGRVRGGFQYHAEQIYEWIKNKFGIRAEDCELVRKYDAKTDSLVANIKFRDDYTIKFNLKEIDKTIEISQGEEITIWRHHKHEIPELLQEIEQAGLQLVHYGTNKYLSHIMVICEIASN
ncbi:MAG: L-histidine N(alpha)-methyltransferase [Cyanobacteriota bacterium]